MTRCVPALMEVILAPGVGTRNPRRTDQQSVPAQRSDRGLCPETQVHSGFECASVCSASHQFSMKRVLTGSWRAAAGGWACHPRVQVPERSGKPTTVGHKRGRILGMHLDGPFLSQDGRGGLILERFNREAPPSAFWMIRSRSEGQSCSGPSPLRSSAQHGAENYIV